MLDRIEKPFFAFEVQFMRKSELAANEAAEWASSHFLFTIRQAMMLDSRLSGKLRKEEIVDCLEHYLRICVNREKLPKLLVGEVQRGSGLPGINITETIAMEPIMPYEEERSDFERLYTERLFHFMVADRTLRPVTADFPTQRKPTRKQKKTSGFFIHETIQKRILRCCGYYKEK